MLDSFVAGAQARGLEVLLTATGPIPAWASRCKGSVATLRTCKPDPKLFGAFVRALGTRYPTVKKWSIWNEPNLRSWLTPQYETSGSQAVQRSAYMYRQLATSAIAGLRGTGHRADQIWLGETAPLGDDPSGCSAQRSLRVPKKCASKILKTSPETFLRGVFCLNTKGKKLTGAEATDQHCGGYKKLNVTGYAHHPYTRGGSRPPTSGVNAGEITINVASRLTKLLDNAAKAKRIPAKLPIEYTEHGWQTKPDLIFGVTDAQQAEYINQSDWIAYKNPRVHTVAQYKIVDDSNIPAGLPDGPAAAQRHAQARLRGLQAADLGLRQGRERDGLRPAAAGRQRHGAVGRHPGRGVRRRGLQDRADGAGDLGQRHLHRQRPELGHALAPVLERPDVAPSGGVA